MDGRLKYVTVVLIALAITAGVYFIPSSITGAAIFTETLSINDTAIAPNDVINPNIIVEPLENVVKPVQESIVESGEIETQAIIDDTVGVSAVDCDPTAPCSPTCGDVVRIQGNGAYLTAGFACPKVGTAITDVLVLEDGATPASKGVSQKYFDCQGHTIKSKSAGTILKIISQSNIIVKNCNLEYELNSVDNPVSSNNIPIYINTSSNITINNTNTTSNQASKVENSDNIWFNLFRFNIHSISNPFPDRPLFVRNTDYFTLSNYYINGFPSAVYLHTSDNSMFLNGDSNNGNNGSHAYFLNTSHDGNFSNVTDQSLRLFDSNGFNLEDLLMLNYVRIDGSSKNNLLRNSKIYDVDDKNPGALNQIQYDNQHGKYHLESTNLNTGSVTIDGPSAAVAIDISAGMINVDNSMPTAIKSQPVTLNFYGLNAYAVFFKNGVLGAYTELSKSVNDFSISVDGFSNWQTNESPTLSGQSIVTTDSITDNTFQNVSVSATATDPEGDQTRLYSSWYINDGSTFSYFFDTFVPFDDYHSSSRYSIDIASNVDTNISWGQNVSWVHRGGPDNDGALKINGSNAGLNMTTGITGSHTACLAYKNTTSGSNQEIYYLDAASEIRIRHVDSIGKIRFFLPGQTVNIDKPSNNDYVHLCYTYDDVDDLYTIYVDGEFNQSGVAGSFNTPGNVYVGMNPVHNSLNGEGLFDDFILVDHAVSAPQIRLWSQKNYTVLDSTETGVDYRVRGVLRASDDYSYSPVAYTALQSITGNVTGCFDTDSPGLYTLQNDLTGVQNGKNYCIGILHDTTEIDCGGYGLSHTTGISFKDNSAVSLINHCRSDGYALGVRAGNGTAVNDTVLNVTDHAIEASILNIEVYNSVLNGSINSSSGFNVTLANTQINADVLIEGVYDFSDVFNASNVSLNGIRVDMYEGNPLTGDYVGLNAVAHVEPLTSYTPFKTSLLNHSVNITHGQFDTFVLYWDQDDITTEDESKFEVKRYDSTYSSVPFTRNTVQNYINLTGAMDQLTLFEYTNSPPSTVTNIQLTYNYSHLNCTWDAASDPDLDVLSYNVTWLKNGIDQYNVMQSSLENITVQSYEHGAQWECSVMAFDGVSNGPVNSTTIIMGNTPPAAETFQFTANVFNDTIINVNVTYEDAELHKGTVNNSWYVNDVLISSTVVSNIANSTVITRQFGPTEFSKGNTVNLTFALNDSYNVTNYNYQWTVENSVPFISGTPVIHYNGSHLNCSSSIASDADTLDTLQYNFTWYKNGVFNNSYFVSDNSSNIPVIFNMADSYNCSVKAYDGTVYGSSTPNASFSFTNTPPVWNVTTWIGPTSVQPAFFNATYTDADAQNGSANISWYVNGLLIQSEVVALDNGDYVNRSFGTGNFTRDDMVNVTYNVTDGSDSVYLQNSGVVGNVGPTSTPSIIATHISNTTYENLTFIPGSITDPEGDSPNVSHIGWTKNSEPYYILYAPMDTNTSSVFDKSGNEFHGVSNADWDVNGTNGWFETAFFDDITISTGVSQQTDYSFCFDMRLDGNGAVFAINSSTNTHRLSMEPHGTFGVDFFLGGSRIIKNDQPLPLGQWDHHCVLINSSHLSYYYNGVFNMSKNYALLSSHTPHDIIFRANGAIDNVVMVNGTISQEQITAFANGEYDTITSSETNVGDVWSGIVTATDLHNPGVPVNTNNIVITGNISQCAQITHPGSYEIVRDLNGTKYDYGAGDEACIHIMSSNVTLDCTGYNFTVDDGVVGDTAIGVADASELQNITVQNCNINDYSRSMDIYDTHNVTVYNITTQGGELMVSESNSTVIKLYTSFNTSLNGVHANNSNYTIELSSFENDVCIDSITGMIVAQHVSCTGSTSILSEDTELDITNITVNTLQILNMTAMVGSDNIVSFIDSQSNGTDATIVYDCVDCTDNLEVYPGEYLIDNLHYASVAGYVVNISGNLTNITLNYTAVVAEVFDENNLKIVDQNTQLLVPSTLDTGLNLIWFNESSSSYALVEYSDSQPVLSGLILSNRTGGTFIGNLTQANSSILYTDPEGDNGTLSVSWEVNDNDAGYPGYVEVYNDTFAVNNNTLITSNISSINFDKDDMLRVTWVASSNGLFAQQDTGHVINNTPPGALDLNLTYSAGVLNCSVNQTANDTDGDALQYNYTLSKGGAYDSSYLGGTYYNKTVVTGFTWNCTVFATDGDKGPNTSAAITVGLDTKPFFTDRFLRNESGGITVRTQNNATASGVYNDNQSHVGNVTFRWYIQADSMGPWISVYNESMSGITNGTNVTSTLTSGNFTELDVIKVNWSATANGLDSDHAVIFRTVDNTLPQLSNVTLNGSSPIDNLVVFIESFDVDNESISNNTVWYKNGVRESYDQYIMISSGNLTHGDVWNVTAWVNDSQGNSTNITLSVNITDQPLVVNYVNLTAQCGVNATANFSHTDYESQNATGTMYWYVNGGYVKNTSVNGSVGTIFNSTLYHGNFSHGDELNITVNVTDGINNLSKSNTTVLSCPPPAPPSSSSGGGGGGRAPTKAVKPAPARADSADDVDSGVSDSSPSSSDDTSDSASSSSSTRLSRSYSGGRSQTEFKIMEGQSLKVESLPPKQIFPGVQTRTQERLVLQNNKPLMAVMNNVLPSWVYYPFESNPLQSAAVLNNVPARPHMFEPVPVLPEGLGALGEISYVVGEDYSVTLLYEAGFFEKQEAVATIIDDATGNLVQEIELEVSDKLDYKADVYVMDDTTVELLAYHPGGQEAYLELNAVLDLPKTYCRFNICELLSSEERYVEQYGPFTEGLFVQQFKVSEMIDVNTLTLRWRAADGNIINPSGITGNVVGYGIIHIISVLLVSALLIAYLMVRDVMRD